MDIDFHFAGQNSLQIYRNSVAVLTVTFNEAVRAGLQHGWDPKINTLKVLIVTPKDIDPTEGYKSIKWGSIRGCNYPTTKDSIDASSYLSEQNKRLYRIISERVENGLMKPSDFSNAVIQNPNQIVDTIAGITFQAMQNFETNTSFSKIVFHKGDPIIVFTLQDNPYDSSNNIILGYSGIDKEYFVNIKGTRKAYKINGMAHEFGHGIRAHHTPHNSDSKYDCVKLNYELRDTRVQEEGEADVIGGIGLKVAASRGLITHEDANETAKEIEALRAIGNLYQSTDSFLLYNNDGVHIHLTTLIYDPTKPDFRSNFMKSVMPQGASALPPLINSLVNTVIGFVYAHELLRQNNYDFPMDSKVTKKSQLNIINPMQEMILKSADLGGRVKFGSNTEDRLPEIKKQPEYFVASMMYLRDSGGLDTLRSQLKPELHNAYDDLIKDFFNAVENYGSPKLFDKKIYDLFKEKLPKDFNYVDLIKVIIAVSNDMDRLNHQGDKPVPDSILKPHPRP